MSGKIVEQPTQNSEQSYLQEFLLSTPLTQPGTTLSYPTVKGDSPSWTLPVIQMTQAGTELKSSSDPNTYASEGVNFLTSTKVKHSVQISKPLDTPDTALAIQEATTEREDDSSSTIPVIRMVGEYTDSDNGFKAAGRIDPSRTDIQETISTCRNVSDQISHTSTEFTTSVFDEKLTEMRGRQVNLSNEEPSHEIIAPRRSIEGSPLEIEQAYSVLRPNIFRRASEPLGYPADRLGQVVARQMADAEGASASNPTEQAPFVGKDSIAESVEGLVSQRSTGAVEISSPNGRYVSLGETRRSPLPSTQSSVLDDPLAALDIYHGSLAPLVSAPSKSLERSPKHQVSRYSRRSSVAENDLLRDKVAVARDESTTSCSLTGSSPRQSPSITQDHLIKSPNRSGLMSQETPATPVNRVIEASMRLTGESIERQRGRPDRSLTVGSAGSPESPAPRVKFTGTDKRGSILSRVLTVPVEKERKMSTAAPGIVAPPVQYTPRKMKPTTRTKRSRSSSYVINFPPGEQQPPAPEYPIRNTPTWTKPDTHTPPPRRNDNPNVKPRRGFFGFGSKPKAIPQPVSRIRHEPSPEPHRDREPLWPFRLAAPGPVPGRPGGTLQRPKDCAIIPGQGSICLTREWSSSSSVYSGSPRRDRRSPRQQWPTFTGNNHHSERTFPLPEQRNLRTSPEEVAVRRHVNSRFQCSSGRGHNYSRYTRSFANRDGCSPPPSTPFERSISPQCSSASTGGDIYSCHPRAEHNPVAEPTYASCDANSPRSLASEAQNVTCQQVQTCQEMCNKTKIDSNCEALTPLCRLSAYEPFTDKRYSRTPTFLEETSQSRCICRDGHHRCLPKERSHIARARIREMSAMQPEDAHSMQRFIERRSTNRTTRSKQSGEMSGLEVHGTQQRHNISAARSNQCDSRPPSTEVDPQDENVDFGRRRSSCTTCGEGDSPSTNRCYSTKTSHSRASTLSARETAGNSTGYVLRSTSTSRNSFSSVGAARAISATGYTIGRRSSTSPECLGVGSTKSRPEILRPERKGRSTIQASRKSSGANSGTGRSRTTPSLEGGASSERARINPVIAASQLQTIGFCEDRTVRETRTGQRQSTSGEQRQMPEPALGKQDRNRGDAKVGEAQGGRFGLVKFLKGKWL